MKTAIFAACFLFALAAPMAAAMADGPGCGVPQGYGTSNPNTFNRSTCGMGSGSSSNTAAQVPGGQPAGFGTANPYVPNSGAANLGSNTAGPGYDGSHASDESADVGGSKPAGYGTNNPYIPNSGSAHLGSATDSN